MAISPANTKRVYDGQTTMLSVNSFSEPTDLKQHELQWGYNIITRGGKPTTRWGFRSIFKYTCGKAQCLSLFIPNSGQPQLLAAVSGKVFALPNPFESYFQFPNISFAA